MTVEKKDVARRNPPRASSWETVWLIHHPATLLAARVARLNIRPHPEYTFEIGYVDKDDTDRFHRYLKPKITIKNGVVEMEVISEEGLAWVTAEAEAFIHGETQKREHEIRLQQKASTPRKRPGDKSTEA
jgi:hypothetical protein